MHTVTDALHIVIDERKQLDSLSDLSFVAGHGARQMGHNRRIFRDYILSSEVFTVDAKAAQN